MTRNARGRGPAPEVPSRVTLRLFTLYTRWFMWRHFHAVRLAGAGRWPRTERPLIVCMNHPSWWDPLTGFLLSRYLQPEVNQYAPIDARAAGRYAVLQKIGLFPVEQGTARGAAQFLRAASYIFREPGAVLWITPQGEFTDVRERPVVFRAGMEALVARLPRVTVMPLALEYAFWDERLPEVLALLGNPLVFERGKLVATGQGEPDVGSGVVLEQAMEAAQEELAVLARKRDPLAFTPVLAGNSRMSSVYGAWQQMQAFVRGKRYEPEHGSLMKSKGSRDG